MAGHEAEFVWPYFFAKKPLRAKRIKYKVGDQFLPQDKMYIRGLGSAYGVEDSYNCPFKKLDYVDIVDVHSPEMANAIYERNLNASQAREFVKQGKA